MEQTDLHAHRTPARLAFADHMNRFIAGDRAPSAPERPEMLTGADPALDRPMILFQYIVEILHRSMPAVLLQNTLGFELYDGWRVGGMLVGVDDSRRRMVCSAERFGKKALGRGRVLRLREGSRGWRRWNPPPGKGNATCLSPGCRSRPPANCRWSV